MKHFISKAFLAVAALSLAGTAQADFDPLDGVWFGGVRTSENGQPTGQFS
ncbi:MAG: hypothetical protein AAGF60_16425 [Pseudomonadota bacterium]